MAPSRRHPVPEAGPAVFARADRSAARPPRRRRRGPIAAAVLTVAGFATSLAASAAQTGASPALDAEAVVADADLAALVQFLSDPRWAVREAASRNLRQRYDLNGTTTVELERTARDAEGRQRILAAAYVDIVNAGRGAVGIRQRFQPADGAEPSGALVSEVLAGFDSVRVLVRDDVITHIEGEALLGDRDLARIVQSHAPGDVLTMKIRRPERDEQGNVVFADDRIARFDVTVTLTLGDFDDLEIRDFGGRQEVNVTRLRQQAFARIERSLERPPRRLTIPPGSDLGVGDRTPPGPLDPPDRRPTTPDDA